MKGFFDRPAPPLLQVAGLELNSEDARFLRPKASAREFHQKQCVVQEGPSRRRAQRHFGGGVTTATIFRIMPSDLLNT
jgi:hypothetical protein